VVNDSVSFAAVMINVIEIAKKGKETIMFFCSRAFIKDLLKYDLFTK